MKSRLNGLSSGDADGVIEEWIDEPLAAEPTPVNERFGAVPVQMSRNPAVPIHSAIHRSRQVRRLAFLNSSSCAVVTSIPLRRPRAMDQSSLSGECRRESSSINVK